MPLQIIKERLLDVFGIATIGHALLANLFDIMLGINWNTLSLIVTTVLSIIYLLFRIKESNRANKLKQMEIDKIQMEIELMKDWTKENIKNLSFKDFQQKSTLKK